MARKRAQNSDGTFKADDKSTPNVNEAWVEEKTEPKAQEPESSETFSEVEEVKEPVSEETVAKDSKAPVNIELTASEEPQKPAPAAPAEKIQTSVRERLAKKTDGENVFVPSNPAELEKAAAQVAADAGFELNRGTSIGARLIARAQKRA